MHPSADLIKRLSELKDVVAIGVGGSVAAGTATNGSDVDLYVFTRARIDPEVRRVIAENLADDFANIEIANPYWGDEDGYTIDGIWHDIPYFDFAWFMDEIERATVRHEAQEGYSTSFVFTLQNIQVLHDPVGTLTAAKAALPAYPDALAKAIIARNYPVAAMIHSSYRNQIARAITIGDPVSVMHRTTALLACVLDIAYAHMRMWHPGEKRALQYLQQHADHLPTGFADQVAIVVANTSPDGMDRLLEAVDVMLASVAMMAAEAGLDVDVRDAELSPDQ